MSVVFPKTVTKIGEFSFSDCDALTDLVLSDSIAKIDRRAFYGCDSLETVFIPASVKFIGPGAFECPSLNSVTFEDASGWWYTSSGSANSGQSILGLELPNAAAQHLKKTYCIYYWKHR